MAAAARSGRRRARVALAAPVAALAALSLIALLLVGTARARRAPPIPPLPRLGPAVISYDGDLGDPFVLDTVTGAEPGPAPAAAAEGGGPRPRYVLFGSDDRPAHIPTAVSDDLRTWRPGPDALPRTPAWADPDPRFRFTWAPAALATPGGFVLYVSVADRASGRQCVAATRAAEPVGPYTDAIGRPLVCQVELGGSIDPSVERGADGALHLVWKNDGNCCAQPVSLWEQDLSPDGLSLVGAPHRLLTADRAWQGGIVENPALLAASNGGWWLFYSGNRFDSAGYATGLAYCPTLAGPCRETADGPFLAGTATTFSPGGLDLFRDQNGRLRVAFATWSRPARNGRFFCCRPVSTAPLLGW